MVRSEFPMIYLVRHGETEWSLSGRHTGLADIPLTPTGERSALALKARLSGISVEAVWSSPSARARGTSELAGFAQRIQIEADLAEWDYGQYEGLTTKQILLKHEGWRLFHDGCPSGEAVRDVRRRADRVIAALRALERNVLIFSSSHFLRPPFISRTAW